MSVEIKVPTLGESVTEATIARWLKQAGEAVTADEPLVELETDKVSLEVPAPSAGVLEEITAEAGSDVSVGAVIGRIGEGNGAAAGKAETPQKAPQAKKEAGKEEPQEKKPTAEKDGAEPTKASAPAKHGGDDRRGAAAGEKAPESADAYVEEAGAEQAGPAARKLAAENGIDLAALSGTGPKGNVTREDVEQAIESRGKESDQAPGADKEPTQAPSSDAVEVRAPAERQTTQREERVKMTRLRKRIAERLKDAQNNAAMLTTFNEVDMTAVMALRQRYQDGFTKKHGVKLGFMGFFVKASIEALKAFPAANAEIDGDDVVYKHYYDIGVAVSTSQGLLVPVVKDADALGLAEIEKRIGDLGRRARDGKLGIDDLQGGTFSITNGGIFGSLMSTPILNPPQVAILGMHKIQPRPMVMEGGRLEARPMMYLAVSYDHRIIDGREAVSFLVRIKECIEAPERILLDA